MATMYSDFTDEQLATEIAEFRAARKSVLIGEGGGVGAVKRIFDGERRLEYTAANLGDLERELRGLLAEQQRRLQPWGASGRAIQVEFD